MSFPTPQATGKSTTLLALLLALKAAAGTLYVDLNSTNPVSPYTDWSRAATNIQDAVDAAGTGDLVLVNDGVYQTGGRVVYGALTNRVAVTKAITLQSANGPGVTVIKGYQVPGTGSGDSAVRCVYLTNGARLVGFTLTNGATRATGDLVLERSGGGVWCETNAVLSNCVIAGSTAPAYAGGACFGTLISCTLTGNSCGTGGGAYASTLNNCTLNGNRGTYGGGAHACTLSNCSLVDNSAGQDGGATHSSTLNNCTLTGNSAGYTGGGGYNCKFNGSLLTSNSAAFHGGGAYKCTLSGCTLTTNYAGFYGGGAGNCALSGCSLTGNLAARYGGGAYVGTLNNCTLTGNSADCGGGAYGEPYSPCILNNCIVYFNAASAQGANFCNNCTLNNCCTTPLPGGGVGNFIGDPQLASASHLSAASPCRGAGNSVYAAGVDIDGEVWASPPSIGCDEYRPGAVTGPLTVTLSAALTNVVIGFDLHLGSVIQGRTSASIWDFGDGQRVTNQPYAGHHAWTAPGDYVVALTAFNESYPGGVSSSVLVHAQGTPVHYVAPDSVNPVPPYTTWATAARDIQSAVDAVSIAGALVLVSNGVYAAGGRPVYGAITNRVAVDKPVTLRSVNGPANTIICGFQVPGTTCGDSAIRCVYLADGAALSGFTLTNGATRAVGDDWIERSGGAVWCASSNVVVTNCILAGSAASAYGAGAYSGTLANCTLAKNAAGVGGGAYKSFLTDCLVTSNSAASSYAGGVCDCTLNHCTLAGNTATDNGGGACVSTLHGCTLVDNTASGSGGGAYLCTLDGCTLTGNVASSGGGGGAYQSTLNNCVLAGNSAFSGGGAYAGTFNNCTLTGNSAYWGGGAYGESSNPCILNNCIVYFNNADGAGANFYNSTLKYCCTKPLPGGGVGNFSGDPQLASASHLSAASPCRGAGSVVYAAGVDIDGEPWANPPSIGCDEYWPGAVTGPITVTLSAAFTNVAVGFDVRFDAVIQGRTTASVWDFGDGQGVTNEPFAGHHTWTTPGDYVVALTAYNESYPGGVSATVVVHVQTEAHYVVLGSTNPVPPYGSWATAAGNIQSAIDAVSAAGALVLVSNGVYATGGRAVFGTMTNRVTVDRPVTLRSVNGPANTVIRGYQVGGNTNGNGAIRCVYLTNGACLDGFTLTHGATRSDGDRVQERTGGGAWCEAGAVISNCVVAGNLATWGGGGAYQGTLANCTISNNSATSYGGGVWLGTLDSCALVGNRLHDADVVEIPSGGGACGATLTGCVLTGNSVSGGAGAAGGGASGGVLDYCTLTSNSASDSGGGADSATLNYCTLTGNSAGYGGGAEGGTLNNCTLNGNSAGSGGGGADRGTLNNCTLAGNSGWSGGGARQCTLNGCTIISNSASIYGGGTWFGTLNNCTIIANSAITGGGAYNAVVNNSIVYYNLALNGPNWADATLNYCCTTPLPVSGVGNIECDPQLIDSSHLSAASPCRGAGSAAYATGTDIDGEPWGNPPSIGCDEYNPAAGTGPISLSIRADYTNFTAGFAACFMAVISGHVSASVWDFGDGTVVSNRLYASHAWNVSGNYVVVLRAYNGDNVGGVSAVLGVRVAPPTVYYVNASNPAPVAPYDSWGKAAATFQDAVDVALPGATVLATNGYYSSGGHTVSDGLMSRIAVTKPLIVRSVNGPGVTVIRGSTSALRCAYLTNGAMMVGFTLTGGAARTVGGGIWCEATAIVSNCVITGNSATDGGGVFSGTMLNCTLVNNSATGTGGGAGWCTLNNCRLTGNSAPNGGGVWSGTLLNCTVVGNSAVWNGGGVCFGLLNNCVVTDNSAQGSPNWGAVTPNYCCTTPLPGGVGNFTNAPLFVDTNNWSNLRLRANSPCINAGLNAYVTNSTDLDGNPRISGGTVDVGAYEFQNPASTISYAWLQQYGLPMDGTADTVDSDHDGLNNWQEWRTGTDPTNGLSVLQMLSPTNGASGVAVTWQSVTNRNYYLQRSADLSAQPAFLSLQSNIVGQVGTTTYTDTNAAGAGPFFYRVGVQ
jgi:parallel beta-helix repeat protein